MNRAIQHGYKVRMVNSNYVSKSVDTETDRKIVEGIMKTDPIYLKYE